MNVTACYFSPTGTTRRVVCAMAEATGEAYAEFAFTLPEARRQCPVFSPDDLVIFGVPVYAGRVPNVLLPYLTSMQGNGARAAAVVVYGNRDFDDALVELQGILRERGFVVIAAAAFIGEHAFSKTLAAGRPDECDLAKARAFGVCVAEKRAAGDDGPVVPKGEMPPRAYYKPRDRNGAFIDIRRVTPVTGAGCTRCGLCAALCPMGSISADDPSCMTGICIKCGACIKGCPSGAKHYEDPGYLYHKTELEQQYVRRAEPIAFL